MKLVITFIFSQHQEQERRRSKEKSILCYIPDDILHIQCNVKHTNIVKIQKTSLKVI